VLSSCVVLRRFTRTTAREGTVHNEYQASLERYISELHPGETLTKRNPKISIATNFHMDSFSEFVAEQGVGDIALSLRQPTRSHACIAVLTKLRYQQSNPSQPSQRAPTENWLVSCLVSPSRDRRPSWYCSGQRTASTQTLDTQSPISLYHKCLRYASLTLPIGRVLITLLYSVSSCIKQYHTAFVFSRPRSSGVDRAIKS
jgi:hypothetical protein